MRNGVGGLFILPGQILYALAWIVSIVVAFSEGGAWGFAFLFFGVTGPIAGLIEGLIWGNWIALWIAIVALIFVAVGSAISSDD
jgi:hypothetical protein